MTTAGPQSSTGCLRCHHDHEIAPSGTGWKASMCEGPYEGISRNPPELCGCDDFDPVDVTQAIGMGLIDGGAR